MKKSKKHLSVLFALLMSASMALTLMACGDGGNHSGTDSESGVYNTACVDISRLLDVHEHRPRQI